MTHPVYVKRPLPSRLHGKNLVLRNPQLLHRIYLQRPLLRWTLMERFAYTMMLTAGGRFVKYALFLANLAILLGGIVMFSVGAWAFIDSSFMERLIGNDQFITSAATLMASGCVVVVVSLLGCLGAFKEIRCLLIVYFVLLLVVFVTMVVGGIVGYVCRDDVDESVYRAMWASIPLYHNDSTVMKAWDEIQRNFKCCGMRNRGSPKDAPKDAWRRNSNFIGTNMKVPDSCCIRIEWLGGCRKNPTSRDTFMADCHTKVRDFIKSHALALGAVGVAVACLVLLGMAFSCALIIIIR
ncbi:CD151 antigen-like isoform X1 [Varroa destructor]|uniref:Tetraspanin n=2 Tax=Varroa destructor TaxID=109461 RepID=A0A7M7JP94_VARDE|nr:CD151 antigen-like isoform X1 [Varroa destructor]